MRAYKLKDIISQGPKDLFYIWWQELKAREITITVTPYFKNLINCIGCPW